MGLFDGIGDFVSGIFGSKNKTQATAYQADPNAFQYGGQPGGAASAVANANWNQNTQNNRQGGEDASSQDTYNVGQTGVGYATQGLDQANDARNAQQQALAMAQQRANGQNLISQQVAAGQSQQLAAGQASAAAGARGPAALALAQQNAAGNTSTGQAQIAANAMTAGAQEELANQTAFANQAGAIRSGDLSAAGAGTQLAGTGYGASTNYANAGTQAGQLGLGYSQLANTVNTTQLQAQQNQQSLNASNSNAAQGLNASVAGQNAQTNQQNGMGILGMASGVAGGAAGGFGGGKAQGGPISQGTAYVVGEQGPEMIVPQYPGTVIPAPQTAAIRSGLSPASPVLARSTWGMMPPTTAADVPTTAADYALQQSAARRGETLGQLRDATSMGPQAVAGVSALQGGDAEQLALLDAKQRNGIPLTDEEKRTVEPLEYRTSQAQGATKPAAKKDEESSDKKKTDAKKDVAPKKGGLAGMLGGVGDKANAIAGSVDTAYHAPSNYYVPPQLLGAPSTGSDANTKNIDGPVGSPSSYALTKDGGLDVMGTIAQINQGVSNAIHHPGASGPSSMMSSEEVKDPLPLTDGGAGRQLMIGPDDRAALVSTAAPTFSGASLSGPVPRFSVASAVPSQASASKAKADKKMTPDEMLKWADAMIAKTKAATNDIPNQPTAVQGALDRSSGGEPLARAARSMQGYAYAYKPGFTPPEQAQGERNVGPIAQNMAADPVASTAVRKDPGTGLMSIDIPKMVKTLGAISADHQKQLDELRKKKEEDNQ
jgi:hypothetical protein